MSDIRQRASFEIIRYSSCWEDADLLLAGLDITAGSNCLSIASAGDNALALLTKDPALVVAIDISGVQLACLDLRCAAFAELDYPSFLQFLGFRNGEEGRRAVYEKLRMRLTPEAREFWDRHPEMIRRGVIHVGKFEHYFSIFRKWVLPLVHSRRDIEDLIAQKSLAEQREFYRERWDTVRWRMIFRLFFSEFVMGKMGRDPEFFRYVEGSVGERILGRVEHALTALTAESNPYMTYILTGNFGNALPLYAREEHFMTIRNNLGRLRIFRGDVGSAVRHFGVGFDFWNLSDIFEYMDDSLFEKVASEIIGGSTIGARMAYWNMLVPRRISENFPGEVRYLRERSEKLLLEDRAFFYQAFHIDERIG